MYRLSTTKIDSMRSGEGWENDAFSLVASSNGLVREEASCFSVQGSFQFAKQRHPA